MSRSAESLTRGGGDVYRNSACCQCSSWSWPEDVPSKQKLVPFTEFDPGEEFFKRGAHAPLMIFLGAGNEVRRSKEAQIRRAAAAERRGWTWERRQSTQKEKAEGKGKGQPKGKGKGGQEALEGEHKSSGSK